MNDIHNLLSQTRLISEKIKEHRKERAARGDNFNIFNDLRLMSDEVRLHSSIIAALLNPRGSHGQRDKYLCAFLDMLSDAASNPDIPQFLETSGEHFSVLVEKSIGKVTETTGGRIDLYITDWKHRLIIENKIFAGDQHHQLLRYWNYGIQKDPCGTDGSFFLIFLTLDGHSPSNDSLGNLAREKIICLSYKYDIRRWLERCLELSSRLPLIRETINQYINTIDYLTENNMEKNNDLLQILSKEENIDAVFDIINSKDALLNHIINEKFLPRLKDIAVAKGFTMECKTKDWMGESWARASFHHKDWTHFKLSFEFERRGLGDLIFGFVLKSKNLCRTDIEYWEKMQELYGQKKGKDDSKWIYKSFVGNTWWATSKGTKDLLNGKTLHDFEIMLDEALECAKGLSL